MRSSRTDRGELARRSATRGSCEGGFTLVEVMVAVAIIAVTAVVLLDRRVGVVQDARRARDARAAWMLASQKMGELELDKTLWGGTGSRAEGNFSDVDPSLAAFTWQYEVIRETVPTSDPQKPGDKPKEIMRLWLEVRSDELTEPVRLEAFFPLEELKP